MMTSHSFYIPGFQDQDHKLIEITLTKHNPNIWNERKELRNDLLKERVACLLHTATRQDSSSSVSVRVHLKTFTFVQISLFVSVQLKNK